jgi:hypothetical protein
MNSSKWCSSILRALRKLGGLKYLGGAGRVVWFQNGEVVDYAWCSEVANAGELQARTLKAFQPSDG